MHWAFYTLFHTGYYFFIAVKVGTIGLLQAW